MFGFNKQKPLIEGPIEFEMEIEIDRPASDVYRLIDISGPFYAQIQLGNPVERAAGSSDTFRLHMAALDGISIEFTVLEAVQDECHTVRCVIEPRMGNLVSATESYVIERRGDDCCTVNLTTAATFTDGLSDREVAMELAMMSAAVGDDLFKLKVHAEDGTEAVKALDDDAGDNIECGTWE